MLCVGGEKQVEGCTVGDLGEVFAGGAGNHGDPMGGVLFEPRCQFLQSCREVRGDRHLDLLRACRLKGQPETCDEENPARRHRYEILRRGAGDFRPRSNRWIPSA